MIILLMLMNSNISTLVNSNGPLVIPMEQAAVGHFINEVVFLRLEIRTADELERHEIVLGYLTICYLWRQALGEVRLGPTLFPT